MEKIARKLAHKISETLCYDAEKEKVIAYGLIAVLQTFATVLLVLILSLMLGTPVEALIICFSVSILRKYSGGVHVSFLELCTSIGVLYCAAFSYVGRYLAAPVCSPYFLTGLTAVLYIFSFVTVYKLAPVDSPNKPIRTEKKKKRMKKDSLVVLSIYFAFSVAFLALSYQNEWFISLQISLLFGILWQVLTLTKFGSYFINKIDFAVCKIFSRGKEVKKS